jgi:hypothetical protein
VEGINSAAIAAKYPVNYQRSGELLDLTTGERLIYTRAPLSENFSCGRYGCVGKKSVQNLDGSGFVQYPFTLSPLADGRFLSVTAGAVAVYDRVTGRTANLTTDVEAEQGFRIDQIRRGRQPFLTWIEDDSLHVLDLTAIR